MEEINEKSNLSTDEISTNIIDKASDGDLQQKLNDNSDDNSNDPSNKENDQSTSYKNEKVNKAIFAFMNQEENSLFNLASSLVSAIALDDKDETEDKKQNEIDINEKADENINKEINDINDINDTNDTSEISKTETEIDEEFEFEVPIDNKVTLVNVLTETDPLSPNSSGIHSDIYKNLDGQNSYKEPTFQTGLDNPNIAKRPGSSQVLKRTTSTNGSRTRIVIKSNNNAKMNSQRPSTASGIRSNKKNSIPSEEELQNALDLMLRKKILPDAEIRPEVINYARKIIARKMLEESYDEASEIDIAIDIMFTSIEDDRIKADEIVKKNNLQIRMDHTMSKIKETQDRYVEMIADEENRYKVKCNEIAERHLLEIENFKNEWRNPDRVKSYNKPSSKLFELRKQQKTMALLHDFKNAKEVKKIADQLEKQEAESALKRAKESMKIEYQQLIERQQKELECLKENHEKNISTIKMSQGKDEELVQNTIQLLKSKMETSKPSKRPKLMVPSRKQKRPTTSQSVPTTGMITYRTRLQMNNYRKESDKSRLPLKFDFVDNDGKKRNFQSQ